MNIVSNKTDLYQLRIKKKKVLEKEKYINKNFN